MSLKKDATIEFVVRAWILEDQYSRLQQQALRKEWPALAIALDELAALPKDDDECGHERLLDTIENWSRAYPEDIFPEPKWEEIPKSVRSSVSASMGRHIFKRLNEVIDGSEET